MQQRREKGFTLIEMAIVTFVTIAILAISVRAFSVQTLNAVGKADQIYQTSATMARNWQQLALAANAPTTQGGAYWTASNPLFACAATSCAGTGNDGQDGNRLIRLLAEGPSAMNPAYSAAWAKSGITPMSNVLRKDANDPLQYRVGDTYVYVWGNGSNGDSNTWAMGPFSVWMCIPDEVATAMARKYYGLDIVPSTLLTSGPFHVGPVADPTYGCGVGVRQTILMFQV